MIDAKSEEPKAPQKPSDEFPLVEKFRLKLAQPHYVLQYIDFILESVLSSMPPDVRPNEKSVLNVKGALLDGSLQVWAITGIMAEGGPPRPVGIGTTRIIVDEFTQSKYLLIFSLYSYAVIRPSCYSDFWAVLYDYAKAQGCSRIDLFSENPVVLERAQMVGMKTSMRYCTKEIR